MDKNTGKPIPHTEIFIAGTTVGTTTNNKGKFILKVSYFPFHLGVMHVSYQSQVLTVSDTQELNIVLSRDMNLLKGVKVKGKNRRNKNLRLFYKYYFLNADRRDVKVLNDSVLRFKRDDYNLHVSCNSPLLLQNKYLGYTMRVLIQDFHLYCENEKTGKNEFLNSTSGTMVYKSSIYDYYQEEIPKTKTRENWLRLHRKKNYYGSMRHFLTSLYHDKLKENGYELFTSNKKLLNPIVLKKAYQDKRCYEFLADTINIVYNEDHMGRPVNLKFSDLRYAQFKSVTYARQKMFVIRPNGTSEYLPFHLKGDMGQRPVSYSLPNDYQP